MTTQITLIIAELFAPPIGSIMMKKDVWMPLFVNLGCQLMTIVLCSIMPYMPTERHDRNVLVDQDCANICDNIVLRLQYELISIAQRLGQSIRLMIHIRAIRYLVLTFIFSAFARDSMSFVLQYMTIRYHISLSAVRLLPSSDRRNNIHTYPTHSQAISYRSEL